VRALCALAVLAVLGATLWPFNPYPENGIRWLQGANGLNFKRAGLVVGSQPLQPLETKAPESYSLELLLVPDSVKGAHTIFASYGATLPRQFLVRQWTDGLLVTHDAAVEHDQTRTIKLDVDHAFHPGRLVLVTISSGPSGTTVYLDGQPAGSFPRFKIARSELSGEIVLGTSPVTYNPWQGEIRGLAVYSKQLTPEDALRHYRDWTDPGEYPPDLDGAMARYAFTEAGGREIRNQVPSGPSLEIPASFSIPHKAFLLSPAKEFKTNWNYAVDVVMNIAGFVPLGLVVCAYLAWTKSRWKATLYTVIACGALSFMIEMLQYYIPRRGSGISDIITNTLGAALGAVIAHPSVARKILSRIQLIPAVN